MYAAHSYNYIGSGENGWYKSYSITSFEFVFTRMFVVSNVFVFLVNLKTMWQ